MEGRKHGTCLRSRIQAHKRERGREKEREREREKKLGHDQKTERSREPKENHSDSGSALQLIYMHKERTKEERRKQARAEIGIQAKQGDIPKQVGGRAKKRVGYVCEGKSKRGAREKLG